MTIAINGLLVGLSLIIAIGPQNALLLRQGLQRVGMRAVVLVCVISDILLILGGVAGVGVIVERAPLLLVALKWLGFAYLLYFAYTCFRDAIKPTPLTITEDKEPTTALEHDNTEPLGGSGSVAVAQRVKTPTKTHPNWVKPAITALVFTWLNPAAYIDVLVMLGGIANQHGDPGRWYFAAGAITASMLWFPLIGFGSAKLAGPLSKPIVWRYLNIGIGIIMIGIAIRLLMH